MKLKTLTLGAVLAASTVLAACGAPQDGTSKMADDSPVVATVNGEAIHASMLDALLSSMTGDQKTDLPPKAKRQLLERLVELKALAQAAHKRGLTDTTDFQAELRMQRQALLARALIRHHMAEHPVTDNTIKAAYQKQIASLDEQEYKARHILVNDKSTAEKIIQKLDEGADFATLAQKKSTGPSAQTGGQLGWFSPSDMVGPFSAAVQKLEPGEYTTEPVKTNFGWHVILLEDTRPVSHPSLKEMTPSIKQQLARKAVQDFVKSVKNQAKIQIDESQFKAGQSAESQGPSMSDTPSQTSAMPSPATTTQPQAGNAE